MKQCANPNCYVHEGESCCEGTENFNKCHNYNSKISTPEKMQNADVNADARVPWSSNSLGVNDLAILTPRTRSIIVGVLGAHDAGKTTLLLGNYLNLLNGEKIAGAEFAGSRTLGAWEALAAWTRFDDATRLPTFPPHTSRSSTRMPGLLHIALRRSDESWRDILLTDAPGEWFSSWSINDSAADAEGAKWTVANSDALLLFADCEKLSGDDRGTARSELRQLIERLGPYVNNRPVNLVWSKTDSHPQENLPEAIRNSIQRTLYERIPHATETNVSITTPLSMTNAISCVINTVWWPELNDNIIEPILNHQPFSAFRGHYAKT